MHNASGLFLAIVVLKDGEEEEEEEEGGRPQSTLTFSPTHGGKYVSPWAPLTLWPALCVCAHTHDERQPVQSQDCLHICLP